MKKLYFVESIHVNTDTEGTGGQKFSIALEDVEVTSNTNGGNLQYDQMFLCFDTDQMPVLKESGRELEECHYVYYDGLEFTSAKDAPAAVKRRKQNSASRCDIIKRSENVTTPTPPFSEKAKVRSYHVNVGHGNCTFILVQDMGKYELWVVDCGEYDYRGRKNYRDNINACLDMIAKHLGVKVGELWVSRLMITHWHFDHISGIKYLIEKNLINQDTIIYANCQFEVSSARANALLDWISSNKNKCYEPLTILKECGNINILYPQKRVRRYTNLHDKNYSRVSKVNESSVVYSVEIAGRRMILPGDLEQKGWGEMTGSCKAYSCVLKSCDFFCISHHGSSTGHIDMACKAVPSENMMRCCKMSLQKAILMGRGGAYPDIYCTKVTGVFSPNILYSEKNPSGVIVKGFELDWSNCNSIYFK